LLYDVVVVGAGSAGTLAALYSVKEGGSVLLLDVKDKEKIGEKVCGDAVNAQHFDKAGIPRPSGDVVERRFSSIKVYSPSKKYFLRIRGEGFSVNRLRFGQWLLDMALDGGAGLMASTKVVGARVEGGRVAEVRAVNTNTGEIVYIRGKYYVDASGWTGVLRRNLPSSCGLVRMPAPKDFVVTYREIRPMRRSVEEPETFRIYLDADVAPGGYWWLIPKGETANIGFGVQGGRAVNIRESFSRILSFLGEAVGPEVIDAGSGIVPTRRSLHSLVFGNVIIIGDAAFTANPLHAGGIGPSMLSGKIAGEALRAALDNPSEEEDALWSANKRYVEAYGAKAATLDIVRIYLQSLSNEELEFGMSRGLFSNRDLESLGHAGELPIEDKLRRLIRGIGRCRLLLGLLRAKRYEDRVRRLYKRYPDKAGFPTWVEEVESTFSEFEGRVRSRPSPASSRTSSGSSSGFPSAS